MVAQASNASFDAATFEIWGPLLNGGRLVGIDARGHPLASRAGRAAPEHEATVLFLTTALFNLMARDAPEAFAGLSTLLFGGEAVDPRAVRAVLAEPPGATAPRLRTDRDHDLRHLVPVTRWRRRPRPSPSAGRSPTRRLTCSTAS